MECSAPCGGTHRPNSGEGAPLRRLVPPARRPCGPSRQFGREGVDPVLERIYGLVEFRQIRNGLDDKRMGRGAAQRTGGSFTEPFPFGAHPLKTFAPGQIVFKVLYLGQGFIQGRLESCSAVRDLLPFSLDIESEPLGVEAPGDGQKPLVSRKGPLVCLEPFFKRLPGLVPEAGFQFLFQGLLFENGLARFGLDVLFMGRA